MPALKFICHAGLLISFINTEASTGPPTVSARVAFGRPCHAPRNNISKNCDGPSPSFLVELDSMFGSLNFEGNTRDPVGHPTGCVTHYFIIVSLYYMNVLQLLYQCNHICKIQTDICLSLSYLVGGNHATQCVELSLWCKQRNKKLD